MEGEGRRNGSDVTCSRYITCYAEMKSRKEEEEGKEVTSINYHLDSMALRQTRLFWVCMKCVFLCVCVMHRSTAGCRNRS